jgi:YD repeat-containing protein
MRSGRRRATGLLLATACSILGLPGVIPAAIADSSIVLPAEGTVVAGVLTVPVNTGDFSLFVPDSVAICDPETCWWNSAIVSLGSYEADTELILSLVDYCGNELFSNDPDVAVVVPLEGGQWAVSWDVGESDTECPNERDGVFGDFRAFVAVLPGFDIPAGQVLGGEDSSHAANPTGSTEDPVNTATGNYFTSTTDLALAGIGIPFSFSRTYNSADPSMGTLGQGWRSNYDTSLDIAMNGDVTLHAEDGQEVGFVKQGDGSFVGLPGVRDTLVENVDDTYTLTRQDQMSYAFGANGELTALTDRNDQGLTFAYTSGLLSTITDSVGREIELAYTSGLLTSISLPDDRDVTYSYTGGLLTTVTDARGGVTTYAYDGNDLLGSITDQNDHVVATNVYDENGRVIEQTGVDPFSWTLSG